MTKAFAHKFELQMLGSASHQERPFGSRPRGDAEVGVGKRAMDIAQVGLSIDDHFATTSELTLPAVAVLFALAGDT